MTEQATYTIGEAARAAGVGVETIRFYERKGLVEQPPKPARGARRYSRTTVDRVRALRQGQALGFSLAEVGALLALRADPAADCGAVRKRAEGHLAEIERRRARLGEIADRLRGLIAACPGQGDPRECSILDALTSPAGPAAPVPATDPDSLRDLELRVDGMVCGGCAARVREVLRNVDGVRYATVDRVTGRARLRVDPARTGAEALAAHLAEAGFPAGVR